jgi:hypothetical protein
MDETRIPKLGCVNHDCKGCKIAKESIEDFKKRLAAAIDAMPFGDTAASFAVFIRNFK